MFGKAKPRQAVGSNSSVVNLRTRRAVHTFMVWAGRLSSTGNRHGGGTTRYLQGVVAGGGIGQCNQAYSPPPRAAPGRVRFARPRPPRAAPPERLRALGHPARLDKGRRTFMKIFSI